MIIIRTKTSIKIDTFWSSNLDDHLVKKPDMESLDHFPKAKMVTDSSQRDPADELTIDVHTHVYLPRYMSYLRQRTQVPRIFSDHDTLKERLVILPGEDTGSTRSGRPVGPEYYDPQVKLDFMKRHGIDVSILSLANPWLDFVVPKESEQLARDLNKDLQEWCSSYPEFFGFGVLPTLSIQGCVQELTHVASLPKLKGVIMGTHGLGKGLDDPELEPLFATAERLGLVIFLHPHYGIPRELYGDLDNGHVLPLALGFPFETTLVNLVFKLPYNNSHSFQCFFE